MPLHEAITLICEGHNQEALAKAVGVDQTTISRWMRGETRPTLERLATLEEAAGRPRGFVLRAAGFIDDAVSARDALDLDEVLTPENRPVLLAAYDAAVILHRVQSSAADRADETSDGNHWQPPGDSH